MDKSAQKNIAFGGLGLVVLFVLGRAGRLRKTPIVDPVKLTPRSMLEVDGEGTATFSKNFYRAAACIARNKPVKRGLAEQARELANLHLKGAQALLQSDVRQVRIAETLVPPSGVVSDLLAKAEELRALNLDEIQDFIDFTLAELSLAPDCEDLDEWKQVDIRALDD